MDEKKKKKDIIKNTEEEIKENEVKSFETPGIKDYKFTIILLIIIAVFVFFAPLIFKGVKNLQESNFFDTLLNRDNSNNGPIVDNKDDDDKTDNIVSADKSGASAPDLKDGMIPVRYNSILNKWVKADSKNPTTNIWYNYGNSEWANAILVRENGTKTRDYYESALPDTVIADEDILAFYVWIPRYKYSIVSSTGVQQIDIVFEDKSVTKTTGPNYITHPAFTHDFKELSGFWVGKFEVTGNVNNLTVLPNQSAIVNQNISSMFNLIQNMYSSSYGLNNDNSNLHLMKNTEWGAVVYLTNSKYGICKNNKCATMSSYNSNYNSESGIASSTTLNINGVYAMNGSVMEYVMGNNNGVVGESGFDSIWMSENKKYYNLYADGLSSDYTRGILGDGTIEFGPFNNNLSNWNSSHSIFIDNSKPWFIRDINSSIYSFSNYTGGAHYQVGFRLSLS